MRSRGRNCKEKREVPIQMSRLRRGAHFPLVLLIAVVFVFCGRWTLFSQSNLERESLVDVFDVSVPLSTEDRFVSFGEDGKEVAGLQFSKEAMEKARSVLDSVSGSAVPSFKTNDVVFVTYASANHYGESRESIRRLREITNSTIIYYDLGLAAEQRENLKKVCSLKVVPFQFNLYPPHVKNLLTYAFKPILMAEMYKEYKVFWVIDASARFFSLSELGNFYKRVRSGEVEPFSAEHPAGHTIYSATSEKMFDYLPLVTKGGKDSGMRQALTMFVVRSNMSKETIKWNLICSLTEKCISPAGTTPFCAISSEGKSSCHRFDQSSVNIIMCALNLRRNKTCLSPKATTGAYSSLVSVSRDTTYDGPLPTC